MQYKTPTYAVPGLMPTGTPNADLRVLTDPDGSVNIILHQDAVANPSTPVDWVIMMRDGASRLSGDHSDLNITINEAVAYLSPMGEWYMESGEESELFVGPGELRTYTLILDAALIPYGTSQLDYVINDVLTTKYITRLENEIYPDA